MKFKIFGGGSKTLKTRPTETPLRFRVLIVGRANAGKAGILKKLCGASESPIARNPEGKEVQINHDPTLGHVHNVEHEITYPSRPMFVFHESRGFEAGSAAEMDLLEAFIARRCSSTDVCQQIHVIWYCISADNERPLPPAELRFFEINMGQVPVIAIFTKCDALEIKAYSKLRNVDGLSIKEAKKAAPSAADDLFQKHYLPRLEKAQKQPVSHICLRALHRPEGTIAPLIDATAVAVGNQRRIQELFILAQDYKLQLRTKYGIPWVLLAVWALRMSTEGIVRRCLMWLPHAWSTRDWELLDVWDCLECWDEHKLSRVPQDIVSDCVSCLGESDPETNFHSTLCIVAGVFIVADRMYWTSDREVARPDQTLLSEMQAALALYQSIDKEAVTSAIREVFSSSFPTHEDEVKAMAGRLAELVHERFQSARPGRARDCA